MTPGGTYRTSRCRQKGNQPLGSTAFRASNPPLRRHPSPTASTTGSEPRKAERRIEERSAGERAGTTFRSLAGIDVWAEHLETEPIVWLVVRDEDGEPIRLIVAEKLPGLHRSAWDLRYPPPQPVTLEKPEFEPPWTAERRGPLVPPGTYTVELATQAPGGMDGARRPRAVLGGRDTYG